MCIDYRDLNEVTQKDAYPTKKLYHVLDKLCNARYVSKIDLKQAFHQVPMKESSKIYTAIAVPGLGHWQYVTMPFGLTNAPSTFQRLIDELLGSDCETYVYGYQDNIIIATETFAEHLYSLEFVLTKLSEKQACQKIDINVNLSFLRSNTSDTYWTVTVFAPMKRK